jgi:hypothetical protein
MNKRMYSANLEILKKILIIEWFSSNHENILVRTISSESSCNIFSADNVNFLSILNNAHRLACSVNFITRITFKPYSKYRITHLLYFCTQFNIYFLISLHAIMYREKRTNRVMLPYYRLADQYTRGIYSRIKSMKKEESFYLLHISMKQLEAIVC